MILKNIKSRQRGFTIVELLVVIVVIGILAAITIVSYTGITTKAKGAQAQANANSIQQVAESFNADAGYYPKTRADFASGYTGNGNVPTSVKPSGVTINTGQSGLAGAFTTPVDPISAANGTNTVSWACAAALDTTNCSTIQPAGGRIEYWDFSAGARDIIYVGAASAASNFSVTGL